MAEIDRSGETPHCVAVGHTPIEVVMNINELHDLGYVPRGSMVTFGSVLVQPMMLESAYLELLRKRQLGTRS